MALPSQSEQKSQDQQQPQDRKGLLPTKGKSSRLNLGFANFSALYVWALIILVFAIWVPGTFLTTQTLKDLADQQVVTAILAIALLLPLAAGAFDISVAANMGLALLIVLDLQHKGWSPAGAIVATLLVGAIIGVVNAIVIIGFRVNSFIATLGMQSILTAFTYIVTGGQQVTTGISESFTNLGQSTVSGIPVPVFYMLGLALIVGYVTEFRPFGRKLYATGGNQVAAKLSGIPTDKLIAISLVCSGVIASLAGIVFAAEIGAGALEAGPPYLLPAFAAVFLGATQIHNGRANVLGTLIAVYVLATGVKGLLLVGAPFWVSDLFNGIALIGAVALAVRRGRHLTAGTV